MSVNSSQPVASSPRLRELVQIGARRLHYDNVGGGHVERWTDCPHPDCVLVREPAHLASVAGERPSPESYTNADHQNVRLVPERDRADASTVPVLQSLSQTLAVWAERGYAQTWDDPIDEYGKRVLRCTRQEIEALLVTHPAANTPASVAGERQVQWTDEDVEKILENAGVDLSCPACAETAVCGSTSSIHECAKRSVGETPRSTEEPKTVAIDDLCRYENCPAPSGADISEYLKDGETPRECIERHRREINALLTLLVREKQKNEARETPRSTEETPATLTDALEDFRRNLEAQQIDLPADAMRALTDHLWDLYDTDAPPKVAPPASQTETEQP